MANTILTPVTLWKDFDDGLPLNEEVVADRVKGGAVFRDIYFYGRATAEGRVKIFARYAYPKALSRYPVVMILFEAGFPFDETMVMRYISQGYGVLCVDYCGDVGGERHTEFPEDAAYARYDPSASLVRCPDSARKTCWYEWAAVARYAARWLAGREEITEFGAIGLRTGGEVLFKIAPYVSLSCMVSVCAAGWLAYRGIEKFASAKDKRGFDEESRRFIAGLDSQTYAPFIKCPVLLLSAINDKKYNYDRVYDTYGQINPEVEKALLFSAHGNGLLGSHSLADIDLFLDKYLKDRSVFLSKPIAVSVEENGEGDLVVRGEFDPAGEIKEYGIFYTENVAAFRSRDWTRVMGDLDALDGNVGKMPLTLYSGSKKALLYAFVNYSNNFSVTSKILEVTVGKTYRNVRPRSRVIYTEQDGYNGFSAFRMRTKSIADCFTDGDGSSVRLAAGYGGILGATSPAGILSYRVGEPRFAPPEGASFRFDAYSSKSTRLHVSFYKDEEEKTPFTCSVAVEGGGKWKSILLDPDDFKSESGIPLGDFTDVVSVLFIGEDETLVSNVLWI